MATSRAAGKRSGLKLNFGSPTGGNSSTDSSRAFNFASPPSRQPASFTDSAGSSASSTTGANTHNSFLDTARDKYKETIERMEARGTLTISPDEVYEFTAEDLQDIGEIGRGNFGTVNKMLHEKSHKVMAVKRIRSTVDEKEQKQLLMELDLIMMSNECPYIVKFYGALFKEGDCWICMELMDISLDKFYKFVCKKLKQRIPEPMLGKIAETTVNALDYLKDRLKIIHRDVKPSNILLDKQGNIKLCDFGISGQLVDSIAKTQDAGCRPYMAPERIDPSHSSKGYDVRSDVWSLGITLFEVATGRFPYRKWNSVFDQLTQVVQGDAPQLSLADPTFSPELVLFVNKCLTKDQSERPKYKELLDMPFISSHSAWEVAEYVNSILDQIPNDYQSEPTFS